MYPVPYLLSVSFPSGTVNVNYIAPNISTAAPEQYVGGGGTKLIKATAGYHGEVYIESQSGRVS